MPASQSERDPFLVQQRITGGRLGHDVVDGGDKEGQGGDNEACGVVTGAILGKPLGTVSQAPGQHGEAQHKQQVPDDGPCHGGLHQGAQAVVEGHGTEYDLREVAERGVEQTPDLGTHAGPPNARWLC